MQVTKAQVELTVHIGRPGGQVEFSYILFTVPLPGPVKSHQDRQKSVLTALLSSIKKS